VRDDRQGRDTGLVDPARRQQRLQVVVGRDFRKRSEAMGEAADAAIGVIGSALRFSSLADPMPRRWLGRRAVAP